jgi:hypothetical protein
MRKPPALRRCAHDPSRGAAYGGRAEAERSGDREPDGDPASTGIGESIHGATKVLSDYRAEPGETYLGMVRGIVRESSVSFVAVLLALRAPRKGFDSAPCFLGADLVVPAEGGGDRLAAYRTLRRQASVEQQARFDHDDGDEHDGAAHTIVLVAVAAGGRVPGGVRVHPEAPDGGLGWWRVGPARSMAA